MESRNMSLETSKHKNSRFYIRRRIWGGKGAENNYRRLFTGMIDIYKKFSDIKQNVHEEWDLKFLRASI